MTNKRALALITGGVLIMAGAFVFDVLTRDPDLPNDANIGAGIIFMIGIGVLIGGMVERTKSRE